ncbi:HNH endonuclease [Clostridium baratii]|uniref:HNH endonuclease n=1 Tax=Clostridium baratii TaxID=1561 RepID=UPI000AD22383|nr:HNH endonuclease [Clostridium baratii]
MRIYGKNTYYYRKELKSEEFEFVKKAYGKSYWMKKYVMTSDELGELDKVRNYWKKKGLNTLILYPNNIRSNDYRKKFLSSNNGIKGYFFCAYCGKIMDINTLTVDHIFPIERTAKSNLLKKILRMMNIENINDIKNLAPCCKRCNSRKGSKVGLWTIRGLLGRYKFTWPTIWITIIFISIFIIDLYI